MFLTDLFIAAATTVKFKAKPISCMVEPFTIVAEIVQIVIWQSPNAIESSRKGLTKPESIFYSKDCWTLADC